MSEDSELVKLVIKTVAEVAKTTSIEFLEWVDKRYISGFDGRKYWTTPMRMHNEKRYTTEQLFLKYIEEKQK